MIAKFLMAVSFFASLCNCHRSMRSNPTGLSKYISFPGQFCTSVGGLELIVINYVGILSLHTSRSHYPLFSYLMMISRDHILNLSQTICPSFWLSWIFINCSVLCQCKYLKICLFTINYLKYVSTNHFRYCVLPFALCRWTFFGYVYGRNSQDIYLINIPLLWFFLIW